MKTRTIIRYFGERVVVATAIAIAAGVSTHMNAQAIEGGKGRILFVVTSHDRIGKTGKATGFYLSEVTHPWETLVDAGYAPMRAS